MDEIKVVNFLGAINNGPQYGKLYFHTEVGISPIFKIYVLDTSKKIDDIDAYKNKVEVYGVLQTLYINNGLMRGNPKLGWKIKGKWQNDAQAILDKFNSPEKEISTTEKTILDNY